MSGSSGICFQEIGAVISVSFVGLNAKVVATIQPFFRAVNFAVLLGEGD
jgi:hypothetical protein